MQASKVGKMFSNLDTYILLTLIDIGILGTLAIIRTIYAYKSVKLQEAMLRESRIYWNSWKERSKDVAREVLAQISTEDLERELTKRKKQVKKHGHRKRK